MCLVRLVIAIVLHFVFRVGLFIMCYYGGLHCVTLLPMLVCDSIMVFVI